MTKLQANPGVGRNFGRMHKRPPCPGRFSPLPPAAVQLQMRRPSQAECTESKKRRPAGALHLCRFAVGLSPRVRGNLGGHQREGDRAGSIPACAGEPAWRLNLISTDEVYPRVCGGTPERKIVISPDGGLSPRVRGNPVLRRRRCVGLRSIPACAGEPIPTEHASSSMNSSAPK